METRVGNYLCFGTRIPNVLICEKKIMKYTSSTYTVELIVFYLFRTGCLRGVQSHTSTIKWYKSGYRYRTNTKLYILLTNGFDYYHPRPFTRK
jgi:hypothetical protein